MPRTETITRTLYQYDELQPAAQARARDWYRGTRAHFDDILDFAESDICTIAGLMGFALEAAPLAYSVGYTQSDYAAINGEYRHKPDAAKALREYAPLDKKLHAIADDMDALQAQHGNALRARCTIAYAGKGQGIECQDAKSEYWNDVTADLHDALAEIIRRFAKWAYWQLRNEDMAQRENDTVAENIRANEYEFTEDGSRA